MMLIKIVLKELPQWLDCVWTCKKYGCATSYDILSDFYPTHIEEDAETATLQKVSKSFGKHITQMDLFFTGEEFWRQKHKHRNEVELIILNLRTNFLEPFLNRIEVRYPFY